MKLNKNLEFAAKGKGYQFKEYYGRSDEYYLKFKAYFSDHQRFAYTPHR